MHVIKAALPAWIGFGVADAQADAQAENLTPDRDSAESCVPSMHHKADQSSHFFS